MDFLQEAKELVAREDIQGLTPKQNDISENEIAPYISLIRDDIMGIRENLDNYIRERKRLYHGGPLEESRIGSYPIGQCKFIRDHILSILRRDQGKAPSPGLEAIRRYNKTSGSIMKPVWGIEHGKYFQNTIQIGGFSVDGAGDTMNLDATKVKVSHIEDCGIRNVRDFTDYAIVAEKYWEDNMYPNFYLPQLAPFFPSIIVQKNGEIQLGSRFPCIIGKNFLSKGSDVSHFQDAFDFLFNSQFSQKELPKEYADRLSRAIEAIPPSNHIMRTSLPHFIRNGCPKETRKAFKERIKDQNFGAYFFVANQGVVRPINERRYVA